MRSGSDAPIVCLKRIVERVVAHRAGVGVQRQRRGADRGERARTTAAWTGWASENAPLTSRPGEAPGSTTLSVASPAVLMTLAVVGGLVVLAPRRA